MLGHKNATKTRAFRCAFVAKSLAYPVKEKLNSYFDSSVKYL